VYLLIRTLGSLLRMSPCRSRSSFSNRVTTLDLSGFRSRGFFLNLTMTPVSVWHLPRNPKRRFIFSTVRNACFHAS
jgi:hypothetical protein